MTNRGAGRLAWLTIVVAILVLGFSCSGYYMVSSFSVSDPDRLASYRWAAWIYIALMAASLVAAILAGLFLARRGRRNANGTSPKVADVTTEPPRRFE